MGSTAQRYRRGVSTTPTAALVVVAGGSGTRAGTDSPDRRHRPAPGGNDTAAFIERYADVSVHCLPGNPHNRKLTYPEDLLIAEQLLSRGIAAPAQRACNPQISPGQSPTRTLPG
jgi:hypothetical protein